MSSRTSTSVFAIYNIIFFILNLLLKISIQLTFRFYISYFEVNASHIYHLICLRLKDEIKSFLNTPSRETLRYVWNDIIKAVAKLIFCHYHYHYHYHKKMIRIYIFIIIMTMTMNSFIIDIIALFVLIIGIIWMHNNTLNFQKIAYVILIIIIIDLRIFLTNL